jgi:hypothetical protein
MRMSTKGGATPRDRRLDRGKVAIAAIAALLFAANAQANVVEFTLVQGLSYLKNTTTLVGPALGGAKVGSPQFGPSGVLGLGSDITSYYGKMSVDIQDTTIQLLPGAYISAAGGIGGSGDPLLLAAPGVGGVPGLFLPRDPVITDPSTANPGVQPNSNYGLSVPDIGLVATLYNIRLDNGFIQNPSDGPSSPSTPMTLAGANFNLAGQAMSFADGRQAFITALGNGTDQLGPDAGDILAGRTGSPFIFFGSAGSDIGTWDEFTNTLTLPVHSSFSFVVTNDFGGISQFTEIEGQLVFTVVPEPGTMTLAGLGVFGLLSYAMRARKRKA